MSILDLFCSVDDVWQGFAPPWQRTLIAFHQSPYRTFKAFYSLIPRTLVATYQYDPYGNLTSTGSTTNLYKFGTRYYDPKLDVWTQEDPQGGGFAYARGMKLLEHAHELT